MIRPYKNSDYEMICSWWAMRYEYPPLQGMMIEDGTFIYEIKGKPAMSLTVYKTQSNIGYLEGYISNPEIETKKEYGQELWDHCFQWAKENGVKHLVCYTNQERLVERYTQLGMSPTINRLTALSKDLGV